MAASVISELRSMREELGTVTRTLASIEARLAQVTVRSEDEIDDLNDQAASLRQTNREMTTRINRLEHENAELDRRARSAEPEVRQAIEARNDAFRRLRHSRRVIKDLMEERRLGMSFDSPVQGTAELYGSSRGSNGGNGYTDEKSRRSSSTSSSRETPSPRSDRTARPIVLPNPLFSAPPLSKPSKSKLDSERYRQAASTCFPAAAPSPAPTQQPVGIATASSASNVRHSGVRPPYPATQSPPTGTSANDQAESSRVPKKRRILEVYKRKGDRWLYNSHLGPRTAQEEAVDCSPNILDFLDLDSFTELQISGLKEVGLGLRIHLEAGARDTFAFMYEPAFFEQTLPRSASYAIDWATRDENDRLCSKIQSLGDTIIHTFSCTTDKWSYLGAFTFRVAEFKWAVWQKLSLASRQPLLERMRRRNPAMSNEAIEAAFETGEWEPFCIKLTREVVEHMKMRGRLEEELERRQGWQATRGTSAIEE